jgi:hypothetical protein
MKRKSSQMIKILFITIFVFITYLYLFSGCQSRVLAKKTERQSAVDSSLYFEQVTKIEDPFFDAIAENETQSVTLKKTIIPEVPVAEKKRWKEVEGFRVQVFAAVDSINALNTLYNCKPLASDSLYLIREKGLYKVQVGDYQFRPQADSVNTIFKNNGYKGAWVVRRAILIPLKIPDQSSIKEDENRIDKEKGSTSGKYNIQVMATLSEQKACLVTSNLRESQKYNAYYKESGEIFKVFIGPFQDEQEARSVLREVKKSGYPDAWLVY